jgi:hypothetical protein
MQAANNVPPARVQQPLPESDFVVEARESIPVGRQNLTTATRRGRAATATRGRGASTQQERGRGRGEVLTQEEQQGEGEHQLMNKEGEEGGDLHVLLEKDQLKQAQVELHTKLPEEDQEEAMQQALAVCTTCVLVMTGLNSMHFQT